MNRAEGLEICLIRNRKGPLGNIFAWTTSICVWTIAFNNWGSGFFIGSIDFTCWTRKAAFHPADMWCDYKTEFPCKEHSAEDWISPPGLTTEKDSLAEVCSRGRTPVATGFRVTWQDTGQPWLISLLFSAVFKCHIWHQLNDLETPKSLIFAVSNDLLGLWGGLHKIMDAKCLEGCLVF